MIGPSLIQELVQSVALSHQISNFPRASLLLLAGPESGKTTVTTAANTFHVTRVSLITGRSVLAEMRERPQTEFFLFNDMGTIRALSQPATALLITLLNQLTQGETGLVAFAGKEREEITRPIGIIGCLPWTIFMDHRSSWRELGFVSRMIPFAYTYSKEMTLEIKDSVDSERLNIATAKLKKKYARKRRVHVTCAQIHVKKIRTLADAKAVELQQIGIRLLNNYHVIVRAHALLDNRTHVTAKDIEFLKQVDQFVSLSKCKTFGGEEAWSGAVDPYQESRRRRTQKNSSK